MLWNYRIIKTIEDAYEVRSVYYESGKIVGWSDKPACIASFTVQEMRADIDLILTAFTKPVLIEENGTLIERADGTDIQNNR